MQTEPDENANASENTATEQTDGGNPSVPFRNPRKSKPKEALPSDRVTFEKQLEILRGFVAASDATDGGAVTNEQAGGVVSMAGTTVVVTNPFFTDTGLLGRTDAGTFSVSQWARDYQASHQWDDKKAGRKLAPAFVDKWFSKALVPRLKMRPLPRPEAVGILAEACGASPEYRPRLDMIIDFLNVAGIVSADQVEVKLGTAEKPGATRESGGGGNDDPPKPPVTEPNSIPSDAPFIFLDAQKTKRVVLLTPITQLNAKEWMRLQSWFALQFFVENDTNLTPAKTTGVPNE